VMGRILYLGFSPFLILATDSIILIAMNTVLQKYGGPSEGDMLITCATIAQSYLLMITSPMIGISGGTQAILSYNYGAHRPKRVKQAIGTMAVMIFVYTAAMWSVIIVAPHFLIGIFSSDSELIKDAVPALKLYFAAFIFMDLQYIGQTTFKSLNKKKQAIFFSLLRKVFIVVPLTYLLPYALGMGTRGVFMAEPVSNVIGGSLCFLTMLATVIPELNHMEKQK